MNFPIDGKEEYMIKKKNILFYKLNLQLNHQINMFDQDADLKKKVKSFKDYHTAEFWFITFNRFNTFCSISS